MTASSSIQLLLLLLYTWGCTVTLCFAWNKAATITTTTGISSNDLGTHSVIKSSDKADSKLPSLFNSFNQYTVDQLLVKVPSILEEPDEIVNIEQPNTANETLVSLSSSSEILSDLTTIATTNNQNVFQNETINLKPPASTSSSPEQNLLAKSRHRYRSIKKLLSQITFNCSGRPEGYYSDIEFDCRVFHYCKKNGFKFTFICPGSAVFNQKELTCDSSRNSERTCRSSVNYYFLNSMLYSKESKEVVPQLQQHLQQIASPSSSTAPEQISTENVNEDAHFSDADSFGKWVTYISTTGSIPLPTVLSSSITSSVKGKGKPKRNRVHVEEPHLALFSESSRKPSIKQLSDVIFSPSKKRKLDRHSSELSVLHGSPTSSSFYSSSLPEFLLTSPSPPMEQIDTPRWFPEKNNTTDFTEHLHSVNKYSVDDGTGNEGNSNSNNYIVTATVSTTTSENHLKSPSEVYEVANAIDGSPPSKVLFPGESGNRPPRLQQQTPTSSTKPPKQPFHVDWDDDDQLLIEEFHKRQQNQGKAGIGGLGSESVVHSNAIMHKAPEQEETANYLFGKPIEPLPAIQFSPVDFETLLKKIPQQLHTLPVVPANGAPFMDYHQQQMMAHFGQFAPSMHLPPETLQMINLAGVSTSAKKHQPKSQFKVLFGNFVRGSGSGGHKKINRRRWSPSQEGGQGSPVPFIWPLMSMLDGGENVHNRYQRRPPSYPPSSWNHQPVNVRPVQVFELQRRTDRSDGGGRQQQQQFTFHSPGWKSSLITLLSRITNRSSNPNRPLVNY